LLSGSCVFFFFFERRTFSCLIIIPSTLDIQHNNLKHAKPVHKDIFEGETGSRSMEKRREGKSVTPEVIFSSVSYTIKREGGEKKKKQQNLSGQVALFNSLHDCRPAASSYQVLSGGRSPASRVGDYYYYLETRCRRTQLV